MRETEVDNVPGLGVYLLKFNLVLSDWITVCVEDHEARAGRAMIDAGDVLHGRVGAEAPCYILEQGGKGLRLGAEDDYSTYAWC